MEAKQDRDSEQVRFNRLSAKAAAWSAFAGISGVFLGIVGLGIASYSLYSTLRFEKLRIQPALEFHFGDVDSIVLLAIENSGFGPAVLQSMEFSASDQRYEAIDRKAGDKFAEKVIWILGLNDHVLSAPGGEKFSVRMPVKGTVLAAGSRLDIINYRGYNDGYYKIRPSVKEALDDFFLNGGNIKLSYCSIDGEYCKFAEAKH